MAKVNATLIDVRLKEIEQMVGNGRFIEMMDAHGDTPESLVEKAKDLLDLGEEDQILVSKDQAMNRIYTTFTAFRNVVNLQDDLKTAAIEIPEDSKAVLASIEKQLADYLSNKINSEVEDLYEEA
jgi:predicted RNase H-like HicB family nuclease